MEIPVSQYLSTSVDRKKIMKKIFVAISLAIVSLVSIPTQATAVNQKALVIIDSYFDMSKVTGDTVLVCLASDKCMNKATPDPGAGTSAVNHGTIMANIARSQNVTAKIILIQTEEVVSNKTGKFSPTVLNASDFINALTWVNKNLSEISTVSFSYNLTMSTAKVGECRVQTVSGIANSVTDQSVRSLVASLKSANVKVFAAAGNDTTKPLNYPACIPDVISVGSQANGKNISGYKYYSTQADIIGNLVVSGPALMKNVSPWFGSVAFATSASTAAVAAKSISEQFDKNIVNVLS